MTTTTSKFDLERFLSPRAEKVYAAQRIVVGALFSFHGMQKVFGLLASHSIPFMSQLWIGGCIELVAGLLIAVGFRTRLASFLASGTMAVAYIQFHWQWQFDVNFFPAINHGELALVYCLLFLYMACRGTGIWGLERKQ